MESNSAIKIVMAVTFMTAMLTMANNSQGESLMAKADTLFKQGRFSEAEAQYKRI